MTAGQIWQRPDGLRWVEVQPDAIDPSGWRLMIPLVADTDAPDAPPLIVALDGWRARVHLLTGIPDSRLGEPHGRLPADQLSQLQAAARTLVTGGR